MVLMYHNISEHAAFLTVPYKNFKEQIEFVNKNYKIIGIDEYVSLVQQNAIKNEVLITFDDGYSDSIKYCVPFLSDMNVPAIFFICTEFIKKSNLWDQQQSQYGIISPEVLLQLSKKANITIGAHSVTHARLAQINLSQLKNELNQSKTYLENLLQKPILYMAYPFGQLRKDVNILVQEETKNCGYRAAFSTNFSVINNKKNLFALNRIEILPQDNLNVFCEKLKKNSKYFYKQKIKNLFREVYKNA